MDRTGRSYEELTGREADARAVPVLAPDNGVGRRRRPCAGEALDATKASGWRSFTALAGKGAGSATAACPGIRLIPRRPSSPRSHQHASDAGCVLQASPLSWNPPKRPLTQYKRAGSGSARFRRGLDDVRVDFLPRRILGAVTPGMPNLWPWVQLSLGRAEAGKARDWQRASRPSALGSVRTVMRRPDVVVERFTSVNDTGSSRSLIDRPFVLADNSSRQHTHRCDVAARRARPATGSAAGG